MSTDGLQPKGRKVSWQDDKRRGAKGAVWQAHVREGQ